MAKESCDNPAVDIPGYFCAANFLIALVLLILGFLMYQTEHPKELHYKEDKCLVLTTGYKNETCQRREHKYRCFAAVWNVRLEQELISAKTTIVAVKKYLSSNETLANAVEYEIGKSYPCWYDTRNPAVGQWQMPSARTGRKLLLLGGLFSLLTILSILVVIYALQKNHGGL